MSYNKIIIIGLSKTGTNSVVDALYICGKNLYHFPDEDKKLDLSVVDGTSDLPAVLYYQELDRKYPNSKFILTTRDKESWLQSSEKHFHRRPPSTLGDWGKECRERVYGSKYFDRELFSKVYDKHHKDVAEYFKGRPDDLLTLDIFKTDGWSDLALFLNFPAPMQPFPHSNAAPKRREIIDVVYPYIIEPGWDSLKYSIRSMEKNFLDLRNIWVFGDKPSWANDKLRVAEISRDTGNLKNDTLRRNRDTCNKMFTAATHPDMSQEFMYAGDDHYLLVPWNRENFFNRDQLVREDLTAIPNELKVDLTEWQEALWITYDKLQAHGFNGWSYETHTPKILNKSHLVKMFAFFGYGDGNCIWHTAYFNMFPVLGPANFSEEPGRKVSVYEHMTKDEILARVRDGVFLNHNDDGLNTELREVIEDLFPEKSSFER